MARLNTEINAELFQDRRVQIGLAVVGLLIIAAVVFLVFGSGQDTETTEVPADMAAPGSPGAPGEPGYPGGPEYPGAPGVPGAPGAPGFPTPGAPGAAAPAPGGAPASKFPNSFQNAPRLLSGGATAAAGAPGSPYGGAPFGGAPGGGGGAVATGPKPPGILEGKKAVAARPDPFVSFFRSLRPQRPPAWTYTLPIRLASVPRPTVDPTQGLPPELQIGPLPPVPRRVTGVLYNGSVSAILETGPPGLQAEYEIVQPGATVPSGVPGIPDLTVESISAEQVLLRAPDRRSVVVRLNNAPPGTLQNLTQPGLGQPGEEGAPPPGVEGFPEGSGGAPAPAGGAAAPL